MSEAPVAIVTGAGRGIGRACATALAAAGCDLALVDLDEAGMAETAGLCAPRRASVHRADVAEFEAAERIAAGIAAEAGRIDVLVNNAGISQPKGLLELTEADWDRTLAVNLKSCFNWCRAVAPVMLGQENGGRIVNMSSLSALNGGVTSAVSKVAYAAAKAGILGLTRALAKELGPKVAVNAVCPGIIRTELVESLTRGREEELAGRIALGRLGTPEDVAAVVTFLATGQACFINGEAIRVDGFQWVT